MMQGAETWCSVTIQTGGTGWEVQGRLRVRGHMYTYD